MKRLFFKHGEEIFHEGQASECAYIIESGIVEVSRIVNSGQKKILGMLKTNEIFGEMGMIDGLPRSCTVIAHEDCEITELSRESFESLADKRPQALMPILRVLTNRLRTTLKIVEELENGRVPAPVVPNPN
jgi:CRP-like cAMP-binding protein